MVCACGRVSVGAWECREWGKGRVGGRALVRFALSVGRSGSAREASPCRVK